MFKCFRHIVVRMLSKDLSRAHWQMNGFSYEQFCELTNSQNGDPLQFLCWGFVYEKLV